MWEKQYIRRFYDASADEEITLTVWQRNADGKWLWNAYDGYMDEIAFGDPAGWNTPDEARIRADEWLNERQTAD